MANTPLPVSPHRRQGGEVRLPAAVATLVAIALYALLPERLIVGPRLLLPLLEGLLLVSVVLVNPVRMNRQNRFSRTVAILLILLIAVTNLISLGVLLHTLVTTKTGSGGDLLLAALQIWATNVVVFALAFWELDRGGPVMRHLGRRTELPLADFRFSQDENRDTVIEVNRGASEVSGWMPTYLDYLYVSLTNSSAFSPTDTMPLSHRAKLLMGTEATAALVTSIVVIAKGVGSLT
jgi:hypothetical protein